MKTLDDFFSSFSPFFCVVLHIIWYTRTGFDSTEVGNENDCKVAYDASVFATLASLRLPNDCRRRCASHCQIFSSSRNNFTNIKCSTEQVLHICSKSLMHSPEGAKKSNSFRGGIDFYPDTWKTKLDAFAQVIYREIF